MSEEDADKTYISANYVAPYRELFTCLNVLFEVVRLKVGVAFGIVRLAKTHSLFEETVNNRIQEHFRDCV